MTMGEENVHAGPRRSPRLVRACEGACCCIAAILVVLAIAGGCTALFVDPAWGLSHGTTDCSHYQDEDSCLTQCRCVWFKEGDTCLFGNNLVSLRGLETADAACARVYATLGALGGMVALAVCACLCFATLSMWTARCGKGRDRLPDPGEPLVDRAGGGVPAPTYAWPDEGRDGMVAFDGCAKGRQPQTLFVN